MIDDRFPELATLNPDEQLELASELAKRAMRSSECSQLSDNAVNLLEERLDYFLEHPATGVSWEELRDKRDLTRSFGFQGRIRIT